MGILSKISKKLFLACFLQLAILPLHATWTTPAPVSDPTDPVSTVDGPVMDVNSLRNAVAVWTQPPGFSGDIYASSFNYGTGWITPQIISSTALNQYGSRIFVGQGDPQVSLNNLDYAVAVWEGSEFLIDEEENLEGVFSATRASNGTWSNVQRISAFNLDDFDFDAENPVSDVNDSGLAVVVWRETRGGNKYIMSSFLQIGGSWTTPTQLEGPIAGFREDTPNVAIDKNGNVVAAWKRNSDTLGYAVVAVTYDAITATWSSPITLDASAGFVGLPKVGIDDNGNGVVVWNRENGFTREAVSSYFRYGTGWGSPVTISLTTTGNIQDAHVVMSLSGDATAAWTGTENDIKQVYSSYLPLGGSWSTPVLVSTNGINNFINVGLIQRPLSVDSQGIVYMIFSGNNNLLQSAVRFPNSGWQPPENIGTTRNGTNNIGGSCGFAISLWLDDLDRVVESSVNYGPPPFPADFRGKKIKTGTSCQVKKCSDCYNLLQWSPVGCIDHYLLYRGSTLIATIPGDQTSYYYKDCSACRGCTEYTLIAVGFDDVQSAPVVIEVCG